MQELISVIVNVYNGERYIKKCLDSIVNQTYKNLEILIIDDGSTDKTLSICKKYKDKRIRIIKQNHIGISLARNVGLENAKGEYFYFIDVDDFVSNDVIEYLYNLCKKYNTSMATCKSLDIYDYNFKIKNIKEKVDIISGKDLLKNVLLSTDRSGTMWNKLTKRELYDNIRCEDRVIYDVTVVRELALSVDKIAYSNQYKYYYLRHRSSITGDSKLARDIDLYKASLERYNKIKKIYPNFIENEIGLMDIIMLSYFKNSDVVDYLKKENALLLYKKLFSFKMMVANISFKKKMKLLLFRINPKICKKISIKYESIRYKYKM